MMSLASFQTALLKSSEQKSRARIGTVNVNSRSVQTDICELHMSFQHSNEHWGDLPIVGHLKFSSSSHEQWENWTPTFSEQQEKLSFRKLENWCDINVSTKSTKNRRRETVGRWAFGEISGEAFPVVESLWRVKAAKWTVKDGRKNVAVKLEKWRRFSESQSSISQERNFQILELFLSDQPRKNTHLFRTKCISQKLSC